LWRRDAHGSSLVASDPRQTEGIMRAAIVACFLAFGAFGCASTREPETGATPGEIQSTVHRERTPPEEIRIYYIGRPGCPYHIVGEIESALRGRDRVKSLRALAFARNADAIIMLAEAGSSSMGLAIQFTDPDCRR
jgi:hypothetical protein